MSSRPQENILDDIMGVTDPSDGLRNRPELPNKKLEVRLQLKKKLASVFPSLKSDLQNDEMEAQADAVCENAIVVSGFPREVGYDKRNVLRKVQTHDADACIIPPN